jgi:hypothetical protein
MNDLKLDGVNINTNPIVEGDVGLVIRKDGSVDIVIHSASEDGREISADHDRVKTAVALNILLAQGPLMATARAEVDLKVAAGMKLRVVN